MNSTPRGMKAIKSPSPSFCRLWKAQARAIRSCVQAQPNFHIMHFYTSISTPCKLPSVGFPLKVPLLLYAGVTCGLKAASFVSHSASPKNAKWSCLIFQLKKKRKKLIVWVKLSRTFNGITVTKAQCFQSLRSTFSKLAVIFKKQLSPLSWKQFLNDLYF